MKPIRTLVTLAMLIVGMTFALGPAPGCATKPTPQKVAANSLFTLGDGVNKAYAAYLDGIFNHTIKTNNFPKIAAQYQDFQISFAMALQLLPANTNGTADVQLQKQANALLNALKGSK